MLNATVGINGLIQKWRTGSGTESAAKHGTLIRPNVFAKKTEYVFCVENRFKIYLLTQAIGF